MGRRKGALVVDLSEAAEMLLSKSSFVRREIRDGNLKAIRLGNQTVVRVEELKEYLLRKEAEGVPQRKSRKGRNNEDVPREEDESTQEGPVIQFLEAEHDDEQEDSNPELQDQPESQ